MSVLRSILFDQFAAVDEYGNQEGRESSLHIAFAGLSYHHCWIELDGPNGVAGTSLNIYQVRKLMAALNVFVSDYEWQKANRCPKCDELPATCGKYNDCKVGK